VALATLVTASAIGVGAQRPSATDRQQPRSASSPAAPPSAAVAVAEPRPDAADLDAVYRIKDEGLQRSEVMDTAWYLTDVYGGRLTNSPGMRAAADWTVTRLNGWGLSNVQKATWGPFGRGWVNDRIAVSEVAPLSGSIPAFARAWTPGTSGQISGDVVLVVIDRDEDFKQWEGKLAGRIILTQNPPNVPALFSPLGRRYTEQELRDLDSQPVPAPRPVTEPLPPAVTPAPATPAATAPATPPATPPVPFATRRMRFFAQQGVAAVIEPGNGRSDHGTSLVAGPSANRDAKEPAVPTQVVIATEHYNRLARLLLRKQRVALEVNVQNRFIDDTLDSFNIVAEIPGTDRADEIVMLGAHFDSWHSGTGATDNAAGSAVMMEAMRILKKTGLRMRRTVRLALWTGEEQGLLGSAAYVKEQFADRDTMALKPAHGKFSGYFNMDNGTGAIRGIYLQGNEAVRPVFERWMQPFRDLGMTTLTIRNTRGTDHTSFDDVGLPGFQFVQDPVEYNSVSHHTNMDVFDRLQGEDLMKNAVIIASFVYHTANREAPLPRKPLPARRR
jgi:hypothetical protein